MPHLTLAALSLIAVRFMFPEAEELAFGTFVVILALAPLRGRQISRGISALAIGFLGTSLVHIGLYRVIAHLPFNLAQVLRNPREAIESVHWTLGTSLTLALGLEFLVLTFVLARLIAKLNAPRPVRLLPLLTVVPALAVGGEVAWRHTRPTVPVKLHFEGDLDTLPGGDESLFVLQLESVNGPALFEEVGGRVRSRVPLPGTEKLLKLGGMVLPFFWSGNFGTHLGMSSILCGTSGALVSDLVRPMDGTPCLPERFRRAEFQTAFYYSFKDADFYKLKDHVRELGFETFAFGPQLMRASDQDFGFGYEDCRFYDRAFAHLKQSGLDRRPRSFVYFSVHMNHIPFRRHLKLEHPFPSERSEEERYLNSAYEQDHCLARFLDRVTALNRDDLNLIIVGDHSYPLRPELGARDGYMTSFYFLPAKRRRTEFARGYRADASPAQDQIQATVLELFGAKSTSASFLWALRGGHQPDTYESCHVVADAGAQSAFAVDGARSVHRHLRNDAVRVMAYEPGRASVARPARTREEQAEFRLNPKCMRRLGVDFGD